MIGRSGERGSEISMLEARHDDDDDVYKVSKVGDRSRGRPEGSLFNSYYTVK